MHYNQLGKSTLEISCIGFGCMSLEEDNSVTEEILQKAIDYGINFFDTADLYQQGMNETIVGKALKQKRNKVIIATKVGNQWRSDGSGWDWNPGREYIISSVEKSLQRLQTDYIDLYQLHGGTLDDPIDDTIEAFERLQQQGKIRYYGISSIRPNVIREYVKRSNIVSVMMQYSLLDRRPEEECLDLLLKNQIGVLARGPLAKGLLINKPAIDYLGHPAATVQKAAETISKVVKGKQSASRIAIQFALHHPAVASAITGFRTLNQLLDIAGSGLITPLTDQEAARLAEAVPANFYEAHR